LTEQALTVDSERDRRQKARLSAEQQRKQRIEAARTWCASFLPSEHLDVGAMTAILLREVHGPGKVTAAMVLDRAHKVYGVSAKAPPNQLRLL